MDQKHYIDIKALNPTIALGFNVGDYIEIQEKIDGSNFSLRYNKETNTVDCYSRKTKLTSTNNLRGAYEWVQKLDPEKVWVILGDDIILFGEFLVKHTVKYPQDKYGKVYFFDAYDTKKEEWLPQEESRRLVNELGLEFVPVFYVGKFESWDHVKSFVGRTELGGEYGEGIVLKNLTRLNDDNSKQPYYTKIVGETFKETQPKAKIKEYTDQELAERAEKIALTETIVTLPRIKKMINNFVDEGLLPEDWYAEDMPIIARHLGKRIYDDCVKEEQDIVDKIGVGFGKLCTQTAMKFARDILAERMAMV